MDDRTDKGTADHRCSWAGKRCGSGNWSKTSYMIRSMWSGQRIRNQPAGSSSSIQLRNVGGDCSAVDRVWALYVWMDYWIMIFNLLFLLISLLSLIVKLIPSRARLLVVWFHSRVYWSVEDRVKRNPDEMVVREWKVNRAAAWFTSKSIWMCSEFPTFLLGGTFHDKLACFMNSWNIFQIFRSRQSADSSKSHVNSKAIAAFLTAKRSKCWTVFEINNK